MLPYKDTEDFMRSLKSSQVYYFYGTVDTPQPHYQVILNKEVDPFGKVLFLGIATSQIDKKKQYITQNNFSEETLVIVEQGKIPFFTKDTCFNCNSVERCPRDTMYQDFLSGALKYVGVLPTEIMEKIYHGITISENVSQQTKKEIGLSNNPYG